LFLWPEIWFFALFCFASHFLHLHLHWGSCSRKIERKKEARVSSHPLRTIVPPLRERFLSLNISGFLWIPVVAVVPPAAAIPGLLTGHKGMEKITKEGRFPLDQSEP